MTRTALGIKIWAEVKQTLACVMIYCVLFAVDCKISYPISQQKTILHNGGML